MLCCSLFTVWAEKGQTDVNSSSLSGHWAYEKGKTPAVLDNQDVGEHRRTRDELQQASGQKVDLLEKWDVKCSHSKRDKWVHLCHHYHVIDRKPAALTVYFNFQSNVQCPKRHHGSCIIALSLPKDQTWVCAAEFPRLCHPSFLHLSFSLSFLPLPITWLVTGLCFCPLFLISPCIYTCSTEAALAFFQISFPDILVCFLLPQDNVSLWNKIFLHATAILAEITLLRNTEENQKLGGMRVSEYRAVFLFIFIISIHYNTNDVAFYVDITNFLVAYLHLQQLLSNIVLHLESCFLTLLSPVSLVALFWPLFCWLLVVAEHTG